MLQEQTMSIVMFLPVEWDVWKVDDIIVSDLNGLRSDQPLHDTMMVLLLVVVMEILKRQVRMLYRK